jgi:hypothetical protein
MIIFNYKQFVLGDPEFRQAFMKKNIWVIIQIVWFIGETF